jgi:hypothetical protein
MHRLRQIKVGVERKQACPLVEARQVHYLKSHYPYK